LRNESESDGSELEADFAEVWRLTRPPASPDGWPELLLRIDQQRSRALHFVAPTRRPWLTPLRAAAMLVIGVGLGVGASRLYRAPATPVAHTVVTVPTAASSTLRLPGGVVVHLNSASTMRYALSDGAVKEVELEGEAYFEVPHDPRRSFVVRTPAGVVRDLGTEFNVRARDARVQVVVARGSVELASAEHTVTVGAGEQSSSAVGEPPRPATPVDPSAVLAWMDGALVFIDEPLASVVAEMNRHYGVWFELSDALRESRITATIRTRSSADAARAICAAVSATCLPEDGGWLISSARPQTR
jgi:transmembrane sensor